MSRWPAVKGAACLATLLRLGWTNKRASFHDNDEIGPRMLARIARHTGLTPDDL